MSSSSVTRTTSFYSTTNLEIKLVQQNTHLIRNVKLENLESEWKLVIYLHQIIRLTMALWKDDTLDKDSFGVLQVFLHNELKPILNYLFDQKPSSLLLSMVGMSSKTPSPSFQLLVKVMISQNSLDCRSNFTL